MLFGCVVGAGDVVVLGVAALPLHCGWISTLSDRVEMMVLGGREGGRGRKGRCKCSMASHNCVTRLTKETEPRGEKVDQGLGPCR